MHTSPGRPSQKGGGGGGGVAVSRGREAGGREAGGRPLLPLLLPDGVASPDRDVTVER